MTYTPVYKNFWRLKFSNFAKIGWKLALTTECLDISCSDSASCTWILVCHTLAIMIDPILESMFSLVSYFWVMQKSQNQVVVVKCCTCIGSYPYQKNYIRLNILIKDNHCSFLKVLVDKNFLLCQCFRKLAHNWIIHDLMPYFVPMHWSVVLK